jgi:superfamily II DNA/RNA helicase
MKQEIQKAFHKIGVKELTQFQKKLNHIFSNTNKSILAQAKNGTGKTIGAVYTLLTNYCFERQGIGLIILPTRELAYQIFNQLNLINSFLVRETFRVKLCIGGLSLKEDQTGIMRLNPNIIVGRFLCFFFMIFL